VQYQVVILSSVLGTIRLSPEHQSCFGFGDRTHVKADSIASDIRPKTERFRIDNARDRKRATQRSEIGVRGVKLTCNAQTMVGTERIVGHSENGRGGALARASE
jgi:hypothetical protein